MFNGSMEVAAEAEKLLSHLAPRAVCVPQEWDDRFVRPGTVLNDTRLTIGAC